MITDKQCQICSSEKMRFIDEKNQFLFCTKCRTVFNLQHSNPVYSDDYFTTDYLKQYGRTYEDDYEAIYIFSLKRLERIRKISKKEFSGLSLLEAGSAMGFFLKAALDKGFDKCTGVEISGYASRYSAKQFFHEVYNLPFSDFDSPGKYDVVCGWYYFEHEKDVTGMLEKASGFLKPGGILAFSIPGTNGPLFRRNRGKWIETHPADHSMDFSPQSVRILLKRLGYGKIRTFPAGIHAERVFAGNGFLFPVIKRLYGLYSRMFCYSDTMEVYAVKK